MAVCAAGLAGLLACCNNHRKNSTATVRELPTRDVAAKATGMPAVRVAILKDAASVQITGGKARSVKAASGAVLYRAADGATLEIRGDAGGLSIAGAAVSAQNELTVETANADELLCINGQEVAPRIRVIRSANRSGLNAIAYLDLESYLCGVLAGEVPFARWHAEALKAQAVTSRSYAYYQLRQHANDQYDVECTVMSQVFKAGYRNDPTLRAATNATRGLVLTYNGVPFSAYFHSTCGGHTEPGSNVFPEQPPINPLSGVPCTYCAQSPAYRWKATFDRSALEHKLLTAATTPLPRIQSLEFRDAAGAPLQTLGRATQVVVKHERGEMKFQGNQFRLLVGARDLKSLMIERVTDTGTGFEIQGGGYGHGVGLCQWGSQGLAQAGGGYAAILGKYYPGAALTKMY
jgi:stage II sporulation protein D